MAVYGRNRHKRPKKMASELFSDEEDEEERFMVVNDPIVSPQRASLKSKLPRQGGKTRSPRKEVIEASFENDITSSPRKLTRFFTQLNGKADSLMISPVTSRLLAMVNEENGTKTRNIPKMLEDSLSEEAELAKKQEHDVKGSYLEKKPDALTVQDPQKKQALQKEQEFLNKLQDIENSPEKEHENVASNRVYRTRSQNKVARQGQNETLQDTKLVAKAKTDMELLPESIVVNSGTPRFKSSVWDDFLDDLQHQMSSSLPTIEFDSVESDSNSGLEVEMDVELLRIYETDTTEPIQPPKQLLRPVMVRPPTTGRIYGDERSFLDDEELRPLYEEHEDQPVVVDEEVLANGAIITNVEDLRTLGRLNSAREEMGYLLEGLRLKKSKGKPIEAENKVLVATLIEMITNICSYKEKEVVNRIMDRLVGLHDKLQYHEGAGAQMIRDLIYVGLQRAGDDSTAPFTAPELKVVQGEDWETLQLQLSPSIATSIAEIMAAGPTIEVVRAQVSIQMPGRPEWAKLMELLRLHQEFGPRISPKHRQRIGQYLFGYLSQDEGLIVDEEEMVQVFPAFVEDQFGDDTMMKSLVLLSTHHDHCKKLMAVIYQPHLVGRVLDVIVGAMTLNLDPGAYAIYGAGYILNNISGASNHGPQLRRILEILGAHDDSSRGYLDENTITSVNHLMRYMAIVVQQAPVEFPGWHAQLPNHG